MKKFSSLLAVSALVAGIAVQAEAAGAHAQGGTLTLPIITTTFAENYNPYASGPQVEIVRGFIYEPLWVHNELKGEVNFRLAESFEYGEDFKTLTIKLRDGLKWSDGQTLDAEDVAFSINIGKEDGKLDKTGKWSDGLLSHVAVVDDRTVLVTFNRPDTTFDWYIDDMFIIPKHIWEGIDDKITYKNPNPVGNGPITEVKTQRDNQIEICRNPHYYKADQGMPYLDCVKFRQYSDNSQVQPALMNDEIDWGSNFIADIDKTYVDRNPDTHGYWYPANDVWAMYLNTRKAPFNDINFRQAFSMAMDREAIVDLATYGYATPEKTVVGIGQFHQASLDKGIEKKFGYLAEYNPKAAKKLLKKAGYKDLDGDGFLEGPDGANIEFDIQIVNGWTDVVQATQMATEYLADIGIKAVTRTVDWSVYDKALKEGTYDVSFNWSATKSTSPIAAYLEYYHPSKVGVSWHTNHGLASAELGALIDEYNRIADENRRQEILNELMTFHAQNLPAISLFSNPTWYQYNSTRVAGWPNAENPTVQPVFYTSGKKLLVFENLYAK